jgi:hypothetical protein
MKTRLNITIEDHILMQAKDYAASKQLSISQIVEDYFRNIVKPLPKKKNILEMVEELDVPANINPDIDLKKAFYEEQSEKYGF